LSWFDGDKPVQTQSQGGIMKALLLFKIYARTKYVAGVFSYGEYLAILDWCDAKIRDVVA
jgi:hypothetical protein